MFDQVMKRSNWVWIYKMGRFAEERRAFLCDLNEQGHSMQTLRNVNRVLLAVAERVNVRQSIQVSEVQIVRAAGSWAAKSCAPHSKAETREAAAKRFVYIAKNWLRFLGKWRDPERNPQFRAELDSFLKELRDERGYTNQTLSTREDVLVKRSNCRTRFRTPIWLDERIGLLRDEKSGLGTPLLNACMPFSTSHRSDSRSSGVRTARVALTRVMAEPMKPRGL